MDQYQQYIDKAIAVVMTHGPKILIALVVLFVGSRIIAQIRKGFGKFLVRKQFDETLRPFLVNVLGWLLKIILFISVAQMVGFETSSLIAVLGASSLAVGLALQGSLANFAGGVIILVLRPFNVGDFISAQGEEGAVQKIDIFSTTLLRPDNQRVILPNGPLAGGNIVNLTAENKRRVDLTIGIGYDDDVKKAIQVLTEMCKNHPRVEKDPAAFVGVTEYGDNSINLVVRPWVKTAEYWDGYFEVNEAIKTALDGANISIPYPQRDLHIKNPEALKS